MPIFGGALPNWIDGEVITGAKLNALQIALKAFLNVTKLDSSNLKLGGVSLANLATKRCVFPVQFRIVQPGQDLPAAGVIGAPVWLLAQYDLYAQDLGRVAAPYDLRIFKVQSYVANGVQSGSCQLFIDGVADPTSILVNSHIAPASANVAIDVTQGQAITVRMTGLSDFAHLPVDYTAWCRADLQVAP